MEKDPLEKLGYFKNSYYKTDEYTGSTEIIIVDYTDPVNVRFDFQSLNYVDPVVSIEEATVIALTRLILQHYEKGKGVENAK